MSSSRTLSAAVVALLLLPLLAALDASAAWSHDPYTNNVYNLWAGRQWNAKSMSDGAGGLFLVFQTGHGSTPDDVYAQHILADGTTAWAVGGVVVCAEAGSQTDPAVCSDGSGGIIVAWIDTRGGSTTDVYCQRLNANGDRAWTSTGVQLCSAAGNQHDVRIVSDSGGGAIVGWLDERNGTANVDVYARRVNSVGTPMWTANGVAVCSAAGNQSQLSVVAGAEFSAASYFVWRDARTTPVAIYAQRLGATGVAAWTANGRTLQSSANGQEWPVAAADGQGGLLAAFQEFSTDYAVRLSHLDSNGTSLFSGVNPVLGLGTMADSIQLASDNHGGIVVVWRGQPSGYSGGVWVQRVRSDGTSMWNTPGTLVVPSGGIAISFMILVDELADVIVLWNRDNTATGSTDVYAQQLTGAGVPMWGSSGVAASLANGAQHIAAAEPDGDNGVIAVWIDDRWGTSATSDIYGQRVERFGELGNPEPSIAAVADVPHDQGGKVKLSWDASYLDVFPDFAIGEYRVWRSVPPAKALVGRDSSAKNLPSLAEAAEAPGPDGPRFAVEALADKTIYWELAGTQPAEGSAGYSYVVGTTADSTAAANDRLYVRVTARAASGSAFWQSAPDSGYSVDNLAPAAVQQFTGGYANGTTHLHWLRNHEADLAGYRLYAAADPAFVPGPSNLVAAQPDTGFAGPAAAALTWKLAAVDVHGNVGPYVSLRTGGASEVVPGASPAALVLLPPAPNPFNPSTAIRFSLARAGAVSIVVHDLAGRRVRTLLTDDMPAGDHVVRWDGRDDNGRDLPSGAYLAQVRAGGAAATARLSLAK